MGYETYIAYCMPGNMSCIAGSDAGREDERRMHDTHIVTTPSK